MSGREVRAGKAFVEIALRDRLEAGLKRISARLRGFAAGVGAIGRPLLALGAGLGANRAIAQEASSSTYEPVTSNYMQVHKDLVVIDGTTNLTGLDKDVKYLDWYKEGRATAVVMTISAANMVCGVERQA